MQSKDYAIVFIGQSISLQTEVTELPNSYVIYPPITHQGYVRRLFDGSRVASMYWGIDLAAWNSVNYLVSGKTTDPEIPYTLLWDDITLESSNDHIRDNLVYRQGYNPSRYLLLATRGNIDDLLIRNDPTIGFNPISLCRSFNGIPDIEGNDGYESPLTATIINEKFHQRFPNIGENDVCHLFMHTGARLVGGEYITYELGSAVEDFVAMNPLIRFTYGVDDDWVGIGIPGYYGSYFSGLSGYSRRWLIPFIKVARGLAYRQRNP